MYDSQSEVVGHFKKVQEGEEGYKIKWALLLLRSSNSIMILHLFVYKLEFIINAP